MSRCKKCNIEILDDTFVCPLCNAIIKSGQEDTQSTEEQENEQENEQEKEKVSCSVMYPDVSPKYKIMKFITKLVVFLSILAEGILVIINYATYNGVRWSLICGAALCYLCFSMVYNVNYSRGYRRTIIIQAVGVIIVCLLIDYALGFQGWSISFAMPCTILSVSAAILVMMIVNFNMFQMYIMMEIYNFLLSIVGMVVIILAPGIDFMVLAIVAVAVSGFLLFGTLLFGDKKATNELRRRFRV